MNSASDTVITPTTTGLRDLSQVVPRDILGKRPFSEQLTDYVESVDVLHQDEQEKDKGLGNLFVSALGAGVLGAGAGAAQGALWDRGVGPTVPRAAALLGTTGAAGTVLFKLLQNHMRKRKRDSAYRTVAETPAGVREVFRYPRLQEKAREFGKTRWLPFKGMEAGGMIGGLGALAGGWAGKLNPKHNLALLAGGSIAGGGAGALLGYLLRERRRKQLLASIAKDVGKS